MRRDWKQLLKEWQHFMVLLGPVSLVLIISLIIKSPREKSMIRTTFIGQMNCVVAMATYMVDHADRFNLASVIKDKGPLPVPLKHLPYELNDHSFVPNPFRQQARAVYGDNELFFVIPGPDERIGVPRDRRVFNPFNNMLWMRGDVYARLYIKDGKVLLDNPYPSREQLYASLK